MKAGVAEVRVSWIGLGWRRLHLTGLDGTGGWRRQGWAFPVSVPGLTHTHRQRLAPGAVSLTHGGLVPHNGHVGEAAEDDGRAESRPLLDIVQPPVGQVPRIATVDLCNTPHLTLTSTCPAHNSSTTVLRKRCIHTLNRRSGRSKSVCAFFRPSHTALSVPFTSHLPHSPFIT